MSTNERLINRLNAAARAKKLEEINKRNRIMRPGEWNHVVVTLNNGEKKTYANGQLTNLFDDLVKQLDVKNERNGTIEEDVNRPAPNVLTQAEIDNILSAAHDDEEDEVLSPAEVDALMRGADPNNLPAPSRSIHDDDAIDVSAQIMGRPK